MAVSALSFASPFCPVLSRILHLTNWFCTGPILVTGDSAGFLLLTTRPTREDKYLRALQVRVATWVLLIGAEKWYLEIRLTSSRLEVLEVS
jgi:hypothetical protein